MSVRSHSSESIKSRALLNRCIRPPKIVWYALAAAILIGAAIVARPSLVRRYQLSTLAERNSFVLAPGFRAELVASEPLVKDPVALAFDPMGRIWVCEMQGYMPDVKGKGEGEPIGRVLVLEDTNGDGRMDKSTVFLDRLALPRAIALVKNGALVAEPPRLWFCADSDGDGKADKKIEVDARYTRSNASVINPEQLPNGLLWAMDNSIYSAKAAISYRLNASGEFDSKRTPQRGQWGITQDDWGRLFYNYNSSPLHGDLVGEASDLERNPNFRTELGFNVDMVKDERVWPVRSTPGVAHPEELSHHGKLKEFTAACGPLIYRGELFPPEFRGNAFVCEPAGNLIKRFAIREGNGGLEAENVSENTEFLASRDERFRPVNLYNGPDGALWVVDMYRGIIEHETYMTRTLRKQIRERRLSKPVGLGRIWRIVPEHAKLGPLPKLPHSTTAELVALLQHPNGWWRDTAQRLLVERHDQAAVPALTALLQTASQPPTRLHALWTLDGIGALSSDPLELALGDAEPKIRAAAIRLSKPFLADNPAVKSRLLEMVRDPAPEVRLQLMLTLGDLEKEFAAAPMLALLDHAGDDPMIQDAALTGLGGRELEFLRSFLASPAGKAATPGCLEMIHKLTSAVLAERDQESCILFIEILSQQTEPRLREALISAVTIVPQSALVGFRPIQLASEPPSWAELASSVGPKSLARIGKVFSWPGKPSPLEPNIVPLTPAQEKLFARGKELYAQTCAACHQLDGKGQSGLAPALASSEWTLGNEQALVRIALHGIAGDLQVNGRSYDMEMPGLGMLSDEQIASILTYIRREWGHIAPPVEIGSVEEIRATVGKRDRPWNQSALRKWK